MARLFPKSLLFLALAISVDPVIAQNHGRLGGTISLKETGDQLHGTTVVIVELGRTTLSDRDGSYSFDRVPAGRYHVIAHLDHVFSEVAKTVDVEAGQEASADFFLSLTGERYEITVTASDRHETSLESFQDVEAFNALDLADSTAVSLGEALDHKVGTGIAKRSFGPGSARPIIRGFDGDRVLVMEDGIRTGTLSSQSGDHGEVMNLAQLDRLEIVKGPATLLYSGSAMGGTVNAISRHHEHHQHPHEGLRGYLSGSGGTANSLGGGSAGFELGKDRFQLWGYGGGIRAGDYDAPVVGEVFNSRSRLVNSGAGFGWYGDRQFFSAEARVDRGLYGVPFAHEFHGDHGHEEEGHDEDDHEGEEHEDHHEGEEHEDDHEGEEPEDEEHEEGIERVALESRRSSYRVNWGLRDLGPAIESFRLKLSYVDWQHDEIEHFEGGASGIGTSFQNERIVYRGVFEQARRGPLGGRFGIWGIDRDYMAQGEEALSPPIDQKGLAFFALEELDFERFKVQFGGRVETQRYRPAYSMREAHGDHHHDDDDHDDDHDEGASDDHDDDHDADSHEDHEEGPPDAVDRTFTGVSAAVGLHADLGRGGAFVVNFSHSYRAPALEELYNFGPHAGNRAFEIGNPGLDAERGNGIDLSLRRGTGRIRSEFNFFHYGFENFVFPFATGEEVDELLEIHYEQRKARYTGAEANLDVGLNRHLRLNFGMDYVDAKDPETGTYLPRIPPLRGRIGLNLRAKRLRVTPELILASEQSRTYINETTTAGYSVLNLRASYTYAQRHVLHRFSVDVFNAGDRLYRNHSSFIKDLAPEIGRGVRFTYMMRLF